MGLQNTAHYLQSKGRGRDTMLVHMSPREVKGLQALALAHGGSLTTNPDTGLPEAGFLEQILPMVAGAALSFIPGVGPFAAAALVGGGYGLATGSVEKGLLAGLGAYGGAGLTTSLANLGGQAAAETGQQIATEGYKKTLEEATKSSLGEAATANLQNLNPNIPASEFAREMGQGLNMPAGGLPSTQSVNLQAAENYLNANNFKGVPPQALEQYRNALYTPGANPQDVISAAGRAQGAASATTGSNVARGLKEVGTSTSAAGSFLGSNVGTLGSAALPLLVGDQRGAGPAGYQSDEYDERLRKYKLSPNYQAYEAPRPNPYYQAQYAAEGGIMKLQGGGGPVERMSMANTAMNPQGGLYPMGMIDKTQYATPTQRPVSAEMVEEAPAYERSNPMLMASGGQVKGYATGGMPDVFSNAGMNIPTYNGTKAEEQAAAFANQAAGIQTVGRTMSPEMQAYYEKDFADQRERAERMQGLFGAQPLLPERPTPQVAATPIAQPTGQSMFPGAASMQGGFGQGAQGYPSFTMGSGGFSGGGSGGPFPLEGQYGIVKMNTGGIARYRNRGQVNVLQDYLDRQGQQQLSPLPESVGVPRTGIFRDTDVDTAKKDALTAAMIRLGKASKAAGIKPMTLPKTAIKGLGDISGATQDTTEAAAGGTMRYNLGGYSDGGRMLKGPGDGMSDSIPATIAGKQPARLADGEFVVPADVVSHLGNGSTDAGAKKLYGMMDKIRKARTGKKKQAPAVKASRYMPA
jgi:hypothetical protein